MSHYSSLGQAFSRLIVAFLMDIDGLSSPPPPRSSLPPSSAPVPTPPTHGGLPRRVADALAIGDEDDEDSSEDPTGRKRRKARGPIGDVPLVKDAVGESVAESFESFLKTFVQSHFARVHLGSQSMAISFTEEVTLPATPASDGHLPEATDGELIYIEQIHTMREYELTTLYVDFGHLLRKDEVLADAIQKQYYRFLPYLRRALLSLVTLYEPEYLKINPTAATTDSVNLQSREFNIAFYHLPLVSGIRELRTDKIGTLMSISGTVTRTSEVRPELLFGSFICEVCGGFVSEVEQQFKYTEVSALRVNSHP
jgi:DNA replication licensing factor MCM6